MGKRRNGVCRFCSLNHTKTTFSDAAHLVSKYLGNNNLYSLFECDKCNKNFGEFESDLANYLGFSRSVLGLSGERKAPSLVANKSNLIVKSRIFEGHNILIISKKDLNNENNIGDRKTGKTIFSYKKVPYVPVKVHKALVKSVLSILSEEEVENNYQLALDYLRGQINIKHAYINGYKYPFEVNMPLHIYIFIKRDAKENIPTHVLGFYFQNNIIYLPMPFHKDEIISGYHEQSIPFAPPYFLSGNETVNIIPHSFETNLSDTNRKEDDEENITLLVNPHELQNATYFNTVDNQFIYEEYSPTNTKYIIITLDGTVFKKEQLKGLGELLQSEESNLRI